MRETRRRFLAALGVVGATSLTGCLGELDLQNDERPALDVATLREVEALGSPTFPATTPAPIAPTFLEESEARARELLDSVPATMDSSAVPNEAVRHIYAEAYEDATRRLDRPSSETTPFETLRSLRSARGRAAMAKGTYEAAVGELTEDDVRAMADSLRSDIESFRLAHRYLGDDVGTALVLHAEVEDFVAAAARFLNNAGERGRYGGSAPRVGEMADAVEWARASLEGARHLADRYRGTLSNPRHFGDLFRESASSLTAIVADRRGEYPDTYRPLLDDFDSDLDDTPAENLLMETFVHMHFGVEQARDELRAGRPANSLLGAHAAERHRRASEAAQAAVRNDEYLSLDAATQVHEEKLSALEALETARSTRSPSVLTRRALTDVASRIDQGDSYLERSLEADTYRSARNALGQYAFVAFTARETPGVSAWVLGAIRARPADDDA
ncbi:hypothetical protein GJR96_17645 [Haloferax sp. MBLA0076]|uniref:Uncharacterized protein n=1 Tax=Haloferax litoreum TaxID=2666140 RepID=A0A6A8GLF3_9EURY|nr:MULTISPECIES: hypothetical protein [Haloferax]KAB1189996.1 hypothetical protein Hfx1148_17580 [Haloferax sp. CBA1148]MRX23769.1 hypothetical protein [Haloferax litoreum]